MQVMILQVMSGEKRVVKIAETVAKQSYLSSDMTGHKSNF